MKRLAVVSTHPIQYYAPVFKLLAKHFTLNVFYSGGKQLINQYDRGFQKQITWNISLLEGYDFTFLENTAKNPGTYHFNGISNPNAISEINRFNPDAILIYGWAFKSHLKIMWYFKGKIPIYFRGDSTLLDQKKGIKLFLKKQFLKFVYKHIDTAFFVGSANKEYFKEYGLKESQLIFAPHAIDNNRFEANRANESNLFRKSLNLTEKDILILFAGKFETKKNPEILLNAFIELKLKGVHLLFVGNGELEKQLKARKIHHHKAWNTSTREEKMSEIHFIDFQNQTQMPVIYQACDLFCLPSKGPGETWGLAINEAMAAGRAVLTSDKVGCSVDLVTYKNGAIFKSNNIEDLKQKMIDLTKSKSLLLHMGINSQLIIKNWSFEHQVMAIVDNVNR